MHKGMALMDRCEAALSGFVLMDLWQLAAEEVCEPRQIVSKPLCGNTPA